MLKIEDVLEVLSPHNATIGDEALAELKLALMEKDVAVDMSEIDSLKAELEAERNGRAEDRAAYDGKIKDWNDRFDRFIHGKDPDPEQEVEVEVEIDENDDAVEEEEKDFYERYVED